MQLLTKLQGWLDSTRIVDFLGPLALRLYLVPIFWTTGTTKFGSIDNVINWFGNTEWGLGLPFPTLMAEERGEDREPARPSDWGPALAPVVRWFLEEGQLRLPAKPFKLAPWLHVTHPERFKQSMLFHLKLGPGGPRNQYGAVREDLKRLFQLFGTSTGRKKK